MGRGTQGTTYRARILLTANRYTNGLALRIENCNVGIGSQVATIQARDKIGVPVKWWMMSWNPLSRFVRVGHGVYAKGPGSAVHIRSSTGLNG